MKKKIWNLRAILLLCLLACATAGCSDDDVFYDFENDDVILVDSLDEQVKGERIVLELHDAPAYVRDEEGGDNGIVTVYFSKYTEAYFAGERKYKKDVAKCRIAITSEELRKYNIPFNSKVYITASMTNVGQLWDGMCIDITWIEDKFKYYTRRKCYLKNIRLRND